MAFQFKLDALLRLRRSLERQQELLLVASNYEVRQMQQRISNVEDWLIALGQEDGRSMSAGTTAAELQFNLILKSAFSKHKSELQKQLLRLETVQKQSRAALEEARRKREILENLRDQQFRVYRMQQARDEQRAIDDFFLMRRSKREARGNYRRDT
ncbi:MAG: flagellar export protein FliJ [Acidobacteria bacterium]|nr:MAG: flagellar export protein FliJ [Acidobacteriota bacterium]